jgi:hypothetical protein
MHATLAVGCDVVWYTAVRRCGQCCLVSFARLFMPRYRTKNNEVIMKGAPNGAPGRCPCLGNVRVIVKSTCCRSGAPRTFNAKDTLPATGAGKYASHLHSMLADPMSEAFVRHRMMAYARCIWPRIGTGPLPRQGAGPRISDDIAFPGLP